MSNLSATAASDLLMALLAISASSARALTSPAAPHRSNTADDYAESADDRLMPAPIATMLMDEAPRP
jgi:hypothetical protein